MYLSSLRREEEASSASHDSHGSMQIAVLEKTHTSDNRLFQRAEDAEDLRYFKQIMKGALGNMGKDREGHERL